MSQVELNKILEDHKNWSYNRGGKLANLSNVNLSNADLSNADLSYVNLSNADLSYADLSNADLSYVNLFNADLSYVDLSNANLSNVNLSNADLSNANLSGANLSYADLSYVDLSHTNLSNVNLSQSKGIKYSQCSFAGHGEWGRQLALIEVEGELKFFCGCFQGSPKALEKYIELGEEKYKASRTLAMNFCLEAIKLKKGGE